MIRNSLIEVPFPWEGRFGLAPNSASLWIVRSARSLLEFVTLALRRSRTQSRTHIQYNTERIQGMLRANDFFQIPNSDLPGRCFYSASLETFVRVLSCVDGLQVEFLSHTNGGVIIRTGSRTENALELPDLISQPARGSFVERLDLHLERVEECIAVERPTPSSRISQANLVTQMLWLVQQYQRRRWPARRRSPRRERVFIAAVERRYEQS